MLHFTSQQIMGYSIAFGISILAGLIFWLVKDYIKNNSEDAEYNRGLRDLIQDDKNDRSSTDLNGTNAIERWSIYWRLIAKASGIQRYKSFDNSAPKDVMILLGVLFVVASFATKNPIVGFVAAGAGVYLFSMILKFKFNREMLKIQDQIPGFLFALKANIQANETPVRAILKIVDNMPEPLRTDLTIIKQKVLANATFTESVQAMVDKTTSSELRFLGTCLIQAAGTGSSIEPQIDTIQNVLQDRKKAADELAKAIKATLPAIFISSGAIPGLFLAAYSFDPAAQMFWFHTFLSWIALGAILSLWGFGLWMTRRMVEKIRNL